MRNSIKNQPLCYASQPFGSAEPTVLVRHLQNVNNKPGKRSKQRVSVLAKLHQKQSEIAKRSGKVVPQMQMEAENERNRK